MYILETLPVKHLSYPFQNVLPQFCAALVFFSSATALCADRIKPDGHLGRWLVDGFEIYVEAPCHISTSSLIPTKACSQPYIEIKAPKFEGSDALSRPLLYFNLRAGGISLGNKWKFDGNDDPNRKIPIADAFSGLGPQRSSELFDLLRSAPDTPLTLKLREGNGPITTRTVILDDFKATASELIRAVNQRFDQEQSNQQRSKIVGLSAIGGALVVALLLLLFLWKWGRAKVKTAKQSLETKRVIRVAEDEVVRELVRSSIQKVDESELDALRTQIKAALDDGDTETAEKLLSILKKTTPTPAV